METAHAVQIPKRYHLVIILLSLLGVFLTLLATCHYGAGVSPDSTTYLNVARNLTKGMGFTVSSFGVFPFVHWPPLYPIVLASLGVIAGIDPFALSHIINAIVFGLVVYLGGMLFFRYFSSYLNPYLSLLGLISIFRIQMIFQWAWSEPIFILLVIVSIIFLCSYMSKNSVKDLLFFSLSVSLACLTRYVGITLIIWGGIVIALWGASGIKQRITHLLFFVVTSCFPLGLWIIRNYYITGTPFGGRSPSLYSLPMNIIFTAETLARFYFYLRREMLFMILLLALIIAVALSLNLPKILRLIKAIVTKPVFDAILNRSLGIVGKMNFVVRSMKIPVISVLLLTVIYIGFLVCLSTIVHYDGIDTRLMSPVYVPMTLALLVALRVITINLYREVISKKPMRVLIAIFFLAWITQVGIVVLDDVLESFENGVKYSYSNKVWRNSQTINYILKQRDFASDCGRIYTSNPYSIYFLTGLQSFYIVENSPEVTYVRENKFCYVWFGSNTKPFAPFVWYGDDAEVLTPEGLQKTFNINFERVVTFDDGKIFFHERRDS